MDVGVTNDTCGRMTATIERDFKSNTSDTFLTQRTIGSLVIQRTSHR